MTRDHADTLQGRKVVLVVTGGIAAYKVVEVARTLTEGGADVRVVMTRSAKRFVGPQTFAALTRNPVLTRLFDRGGDVPHVELARSAALLVVAPATANFLAKMAHGFADDLASATVLTADCPILVAPAMHTEMWEHPATQRNLALLREHGVTFVGPEEGALSSGDTGRGRLAEPAEIVEAARDALARSQDLAGRHVLVTAGGTQERLDPVRYLGNRSSGRMGYAIAREAFDRGAKVTLVVGAGATETPPPGVDLVRVVSADEMRAAVFDRAPSADVIVKAAAVADFKPRSQVREKLKKAQGPPPVELVPTPDILRELGSSPEARKPGALLVGFAAETTSDPQALAGIARDKLHSKGANMIVANDVASSDSGFETRTNRAVIADAEGVDDVGLVSKEELARVIVDRVIAHLGKGRDT